MGQSSRRGGRERVGAGKTEGGRREDSFTDKRETRST